MNKWKLDLPIDEIARRYTLGENTYELGRAYGVTQMTIWNRLRAAGVKTRPRGANMLGNKHALGHRGNGWRKRGGSLHIGGRGYLRTLDREGKTCGIHRGCWEAYHGPILNGHDIHHINEDRLDHAIENLACITHAEHTRMHHEHAK